MRKFLFIILFCTVFFICSVNAATVYSEGFESGIGGWTLTHTGNAADWSASSSDPYSGSGHAQSNPQEAGSISAIEKIYSTSGYENISISYYRKLVGLDSVDWFRFMWYDGSSWNTLEEKNAENGNYVLKSFNFSATADDNANFKIKYECTAGAVSEYCRVDDIIISGIFIDNLAPSFSNYVEDPINNSNYQQGRAYYFNVTINEGNLQSYGIEFNGVNYTITNLSNSFSFNIYDLGAGNYQYYWWANDTNGNYNSSELRSFTVNKAIPDITKEINGLDYNLTAEYLTQVNASGNTDYGDLNIYIDGIMMNNGKNYTLSAGYYRIDFNVTGNQNYSDYSESLYVDITKKSAKTSLSFDVQSPQTYGQSITPYCGVVEGENNAILKVNGVTITSGNPIILGGGTWTFNCSIAESQNYTLYSNTSEYFIDKAISDVYVNLSGGTVYGNYTNFSCTNSKGLFNVLYINGFDKSSENSRDIVRGAGTYNVNCSTISNQNYSANSIIEQYNISKANSIDGMSLSGNESLIYGTISDFVGSEINFEDSGCVYSLNRPNGIYGVGTWTFNYSTSGCYNYSSGSVVKSLEVNKNSPTGMLISVTPSLNVIYGTQTSASWSETNNGDEDLSYGFFRNNASIANPNTETLNAGIYNYVLNTSGGQNYTSGSVNVTLVVNKSGNNLGLLLNGTSKNISLIYEQLLNISGTSSSGTYNIYMNDVDVTSFNNQKVLFASGYYGIKINSTGNVNYFENSTGITLYVNISKADSEVRLFINGSRNNLTIQEDNYINITSYLVKGQGEIETYINDNIIYKGVSGGYNFTEFADPGIYNITLIYNENENYTYDYETFYINITEAPDIMPPSVSIIRPSNGQSFGYNQSLPLNISVFDTKLDSCWYNLDNGDNISLGGCQNLTFDASEGSHIIYVFANDTSGNIGFDSNSFSINIGAPDIILNSPTYIYFPYEEIIFDYIATDPDGIDSCSIYFENNGTMILNQSNYTILSGEEGIFNITLKDGLHNFSLICNDSFGESSTTNNNTIIIDTVYPDITLIEPVGEKNSRNNIPISFSLNESYVDSCWYNVYRGIDLEIPNTQINCTSPGDFSVAVDANFIINLYVEDSAGNQKSVNSSFVVSSNVPDNGDSGGGSSSGGGGGTVIISDQKNLTPSLDFGSLGDIIISPGESKTLELIVRNTGEVFMNKCKLKGKENYTSWIRSDTLKNINPGEISEYIFEINVPVDANRSDDAGLILECVEKEFFVPINIIVLTLGLEVQLESLYLLDGDNLAVNYTLIGNSDFEETLVFKVFDDEENLLSEKSEIVDVTSGKLDKGTILDVSNADKGLLRIEISKLSGAVIVDEYFVYDSKQPITGLAFFDRFGTTSFYTFFIILIFLILSFVIVRKIVSLNKIKNIVKKHKMIK
jgi:hypothetical protein